MDEHKPHTSEDILSQPPPAADARLAYGSDPNQFGEMRLPTAGAQGKAAKHPLIMFLHGGFWRAKYGLAHAGHICAGFTKLGYATWNTEYRRVGNDGGAWPGTFEDITNSYQFLRQLAAKHELDLERFAVMGHSAGGQLALALAAHQKKTIKRAVSLAGVLDLERAYALHLSHDAAAEFMGGTPQQVEDHYHEASPQVLDLHGVSQLIVHGDRDDTVPVEMSREYVSRKKKAGEQVELLELSAAGHYELIDPGAKEFATIARAVDTLMRSS